MYEETVNDNDIYINIYDMALREAVEKSSDFGVATFRDNASIVAF